MYVDKLDGKIDGDFFDKMAGQWREEQRRLQHDIDRHEEAEQSYMDEGVRILELARNAKALFEQQPAREKRRLLNFVLSNCSWEDGEVVATLRQPFDLLAETTAIAARSSAGSDRNSTKNEIWLCSQSCAIQSKFFPANRENNRENAENFTPKASISQNCPCISVDCGEAGTELTGKEQGKSALPTTTSQNA
jgi:hypothetical protein